MASIGRRTGGRIRRSKGGSNSAERVECCDDLITDILSRVSTTDVIKMSTVSKRWRTLIFNPDFAYKHFKNRHRESILCLTDIHTFRNPTRIPRIMYGSPRLMPKRVQFCSFNSQPGNLSIVPFSFEGLDSSFQNGDFLILTSSNGLMLLYPSRPLDPLLWVYNPVRKVSKKLSMPFEVDIRCIVLAEVCYMQSALKFVIAGFSISQKRRYTLVFDSHSNSWYEGPPLLIDLKKYNDPRVPLFFNGVIYCAVRVNSIDDQELGEIRDVDALFRDERGSLQMIIGYDVNRDQWGFSIFIPSTVGSVYCLIESEGNLLVCAASGDGHFVLWILDTEHKRWIRERDLKLSHRVGSHWEVSASGGVVWFTRGYNSIKVYHMKNRHWSTYRLDDALAPQKRICTPFVTFEPTLLLL